jgi:TatA/E family protein of Tat protein translocase
MLMLVLIVLLLFGAARLPRLARSMREAREEFQKGQDAAKPPPADGEKKASEVPEAHTEHPEPVPTESDQK